MTTFISAEYVIAYALLDKMNKGLDAVTFNEVRELANKIQVRLNEADIDAVVISHNIPDTIYQFGEYFEMVTLNNTNYIKCKRGVSASKLESRFIGYLSLDTLKIIVNTLSI